MLYMGSSDLNEEIYSLIKASLTSCNSVKALFTAASKSSKNLPAYLFALLSDISLLKKSSASLPLRYFSFPFLNISVMILSYFS